jgi:phage protein D/phage baseplate assembly protein gpV
MTDAGRKQSQLYLSLGGEPAGVELMRDLEQVTVESSLHLPDVATLILHDPALRWVDSELFEPGTALRVSARAGNGEGDLFDGEVVELEPAFDGAVPRLLVRAFDRLHRLARGRAARAFVNVSDADLVRQLADEAGLKARVGPAANTLRQHVMQANESALAFLQSRAAALGYLLYVEGETLCCLPPEQGRSAITLAWGEQLSAFHPRLSTVGQVNRVRVRGWNPRAKRAVLGEAGAGTLDPDVGSAHARGKSPGGVVAERAFGRPVELLVADRPIHSQDAADGLAQAVADRRGAQFIEAEGCCSGSPTLLAGVRVTIAGVGERFGGSYFVTAATHTSDPSGDYSTAFSVSGLSPATLLSRMAERPDDGPPGGLVIGVVSDNLDPENMGRVRVAFPWLNPDHASDWARVLAVGAGEARGIQFLPEVGDEVLVGFEMGDAQQPFVLGGLWNGVDHPPLRGDEAVAGEVRRRVIRSRTGHELLFDDAQDGGVTIRDRRGNTIRLSSADDLLTVEAVGELRLRAATNLSIEAAGRVAISGQGVEVDGGSATVDVRATMINLN